MNPSNSFSLESTEKSMNELRSSVLIVGHPNPEDILFGADFLDEAPIDELEWPLQSFNVIAIKINQNNFSKSHQFLQKMMRSRPHLQKVIISDQLTLSSIQDLINSGNVFRMLNSFKDSSFEESILLGLEESSRWQQRLDLQEMATDQNIRLKALTAQLEEMVARREKNLKRSKKRLLTTTKKVESLHRALMAIHNANSVGEMGGLLTEALSDYLELEWTRIFFSSASSLTTAREEWDFELCSAPLIIESRNAGEIVFARSAGTPFTKEQQDFLFQVAEGVALAIDRLTKHDQAEGLKQQWESTFDAISDPLCLVDEHYQILRSNRAFANSAKACYKELVSKNAFTIFFGNEKPPGLPELSDNFEFQTVRQEENSQSTFMVTCQTPPDENEGAKIRLLLFHDITDELRMERQILESAKMAEIGTIGSSIAHELNNPLGGMTSFLQLLKMDCLPEDPIYSDLIEMEAAAKKCKEIIENLLGFSRRSDSLEMKNLDLREVILQSLKITELQTRSRGIRTNLNLPDTPVEIEGIFNLLSQAICNLLQNAYEAIYVLLKENPRYEGLINIDLTASEQHVQLNITDNGEGISTKSIYQVFNPLYSTKNPESHSGLGLTVAQKIIKDHQGSIELISQPNKGTQAKIAFHRPESST